HACRARVTVGAGFVGRARLLLPQRLARLDEQHGRVRGVVVLHLLQRRAHILVARTARLARLRHGKRGGEQRSEAEAGREPRHVTAMATRCSATKPSSPVQRKPIVPLSVATAKNETNGLAAIAGEKSMLKI